MQTHAVQDEFLLDFDRSASKEEVCTSGMEATATGWYLQDFSGGESRHALHQNSTQAPSEFAVAVTSKLYALLAVKAGCHVDLRGAAHNTIGCNSMCGVQRRQLLGISQQELVSLLWVSDRLELIQHALQSLGYLVFLRM